MSGEDEDRQAILRRRNRLIALALSGLGAAAGCDDAAPPTEPSELTAPELVPEPEPVAPALVPIPPGVVELPDEPRVEPPPVDRAREIRHAEEAKRQWRRRNAQSVPCLSPLPSVCLLMFKPDELDDPDPE